MPDDAQPADTSLEELERRVAAFESATKRLRRNVGGDEAVPAPAPAATTPGAGSSASRAAFAPAGEEISGLRPSVPAPTPVTGALTARRRTGESSGQHSPGFTSAFGKPSIPVLPGAAETAPGVVSTTRRAVRPQPWWTRRRIYALAAAVAVLTVLAGLPRAFREQGGAEVWAETVRCQAPVAGVVAAVNVQVGDAVAAGSPLVRIGETLVPAPQEGVVARLFATQQTRLAAGEPVAEIARPATLRVVLPLQPGREATAGDRVSVRLIGENRVLGGMIERIFAPGEPGAWNGSGPPPRRAAIMLDPTPAPPRLGLGAGVTLLGRDPGPMAQALFSLRRMLPW